MLLYHISLLYYIIIIIYAYIHIHFLILLFDELIKIV